MPSKSKAQHRFWLAKEHDPNATTNEKKIAKEFILADKHSHKKLPERLHPKD